MKNLRGGSSAVSLSQAWAILSRHARDEISSLRLQELCKDNDRVSSLVAVYNSENSNDHVRNNLLICDLSRQRMTDATLNHLLNLGASMGLKHYIRQISWGRNNPNKPVVRPTSKRQQQPQLPTIDPARKRQVMQILVDHRNSNTLASTVPSMHIALRVPAGKGYEMIDTLSSSFVDDTSNNALAEIHQEWSRIERLSESIRTGEQRGASGQVLRDVIVVGRGVAVEALQFVYTALQHDERAAVASRLGKAALAARNQQDTTASARMRLAHLTGGGGGSSGTGSNGNSSGSTVHRMKFVTSVDPLQLASVTADLDPAATLVVSVAVSGTEETGLATKSLKTWLIQGLKNRPTGSILDKHMILITGNERIASFIHKPESVFVLPEHSRCEAFLSCSVVTLLVRTRLRLCLLRSQ